MNYSLSFREGVCVVHLNRLLSDTDNRAILDEVTQSLLEKDCTQVVIDLALLEYMDSNGLNLLIALWRHQGQSGGRLYLTHPKPAVNRLLEVTRLKGIFDFIPSPEAVPVI
jgi:anti-anti-sigma factor